MRRSLTISAVLACSLVSGAAWSQAPDEESPAVAATPSEEAAPSPAQASPSTGVQTPLALAEEAAELHRRGEYDAAQPKLEKAYAELPLPTIGIWLARNLDRLERLLDAQARYRALVDEEDRATESALAAATSKGWSPPRLDDQQEAKRNAEVELEQLVARIPTMIVVVSGDDGRAEVTLDGEAAPVGEPRQLDPGPYRIEGRLGDETIVRAVVLHERDRATVGLPFRAKPAVSAPGTAQTVVGWVLVGVGGAAAIGGGVLAGIAAARLGDLDCPDNQCQPSQRGDMDAYNGLRLPSGFLLLGGGLLAATGVAVVINAPSRHDESTEAQPSSRRAAPSLSAVVGPGLVGLRGTF